MENKGYSIVMMHRILLSCTTAAGGGTLFQRPPNESIPWLSPSAFLEEGTKALYSKPDVPSVKIVQAQAEYVGIDGRSRSCAANF